MRADECLFGFAERQEELRVEQCGFERRLSVREGVVVAVRAGANGNECADGVVSCLLYTSPSPRD